MIDVRRLNVAACFACGQRLRSWQAAYMEDDDQQAQPVGSDCFRHIIQGGAQGWQPPKGGPRLYQNRDDARRAAGMQDTDEGQRP